MIGPFSRELGLAQALEVNKGDRAVAEGVSYRVSYVSPPRCAPALFVFPPSCLHNPPRGWDTLPTRFHEEPLNFRSG